MYVLVADETVRIAEMTTDATEWEPQWHRVDARSEDGDVILAGASMAGESKILVVWREAGVAPDKNARLYDSFLEV